MDTTTFKAKQGLEPGSADRIKTMLKEEQGVARVLVREDRGEIYVRHSRAKAPRHRLLGLLTEAGLALQVKRR